MDAPALVNEKKMIDVNTAPFEEIEGAAKLNRPARVAAELEADEEFAADTEIVEDESAL
jgi:hypothetical protein